MKRLLSAAFVMGAVGLVQAQPAADARTQYDAAYQAMMRGDFAGAEGGFTAAAAMTDDAELRGAANQLARLANDLASRNARLAYGPPGAADMPPMGPGAVGADGRAPGVEGGSPAMSEDDTKDGGRATFVVTTTIASLYSGVVLIDLLDAGNVRTGTLIVMGSTAAGLVGSLYGTKDRTMTGGMADSWSLGLVVGAANSLLLGGPIGLFDGDNASEKVGSVTLGAAWGTATAGLLLADHYKPTRAQVSVTGTVGMMGVASTLLSLAIVQPDSIDGNTFLTLTAVGLDASLVAGAVASSKLDWSQSRARYVGLGALVGGLAGVGGSLLLLSDGGGDNSARLAAGLTLGGMWGGFALSAHLTRDMAPDYRFRAKKPIVEMTLAPTRIKDAPALAVVGSF